VLGGWLIDVFRLARIFCSTSACHRRCRLALVYIAILPRRATPIDLAGALLAAVSLACSPGVLTAGAAAAAVERGHRHARRRRCPVRRFSYGRMRRGDKAMMPLALFRSSDFVDSAS